MGLTRNQVNGIAGIIFWILMACIAFVPCYNNPKAEAEVEGPHVTVDIVETSNKAATITLHIDNRYINNVTIVPVYK